MGFRCRLALTGSWNLRVHCRPEHRCHSLPTEVHSCLGHALQISFSWRSDLNAHWISSCAILSNTHSSNLRPRRSRSGDTCERSTLRPATVCQDLNRSDGLTLDSSTDPSPTQVAFPQQAMFQEAPFFLEE